MLASYLVREVEETNEMLVWEGVCLTMRAVGST